MLLSCVYTDYVLRNKRCAILMQAIAHAHGLGGGEAAMTEKMQQKQTEQTSQIQVV